MGYISDQQKGYDDGPGRTVGDYQTPGQEYAAATLMGDVHRQIMDILREPFTQ